MKRKSKFLLATLTPIAIASPFVAMISCQPGVNNSEREEQLKKLKQEITKSIINTDLRLQIVADVQKIENFNIETDFAAQGPIYKQAYEAFKHWQDFQINKTRNVKWALDQLEKWASDQAFLNNLSEYQQMRTKLSKSDSWKFDEEDFKILWKTANTYLADTISKMLLVKTQMLEGDKINIASSNIYKNTVKVPSNDATTDVWNTHRAFTNVKPNDADFFLIQYLFKNSPAYLWKYENSNQDVNVTWENEKVSGIKGDSNNLKFFNSWVDAKKTPSNTNTIKEFELWNESNIKEKELLSFQGIVTNTISRGDMSSKIDDVLRKSLYKNFIGFIDTSLTSGDAVFSLEDIKYANEWNNARQIPVKVKESFNIKEKTFLDLTTNDLEFIRENESDKIKYELMHLVQEVSMNNNEYINDRRGNVIIKASLKSDPKSFKIYPVHLDWSSKDVVKYYWGISNSNEYKQNGILPKFDQLPSKDGVKISDGSKILIRYVVKVNPLPEFVDTDSKNNKTIKRMFFSMKNTLWNTKETKEKLLYNLYLNDEKVIFQGASEFFESQGYKIEALDEDLKLGEEETQ